MTKVLHIIKSLGRGGAEMLLQETLPYHDREKFEFHYIYFLPWKDQMVKGIQQHGGIVNNFAATNNISIMLQARKIAKYIRKNNIELVHCHLPWAGFVGRIVHRITKIPVVYSEHNKQERYRSVTKYLNKVTYNWQTSVIAVSGDVAGSIEKNIHPSIPVHTLLNGVAVEKFNRSTEDGLRIRKEYGISDDAIVIGTIAVFRFQKRLKEWIDVFKATEAKHPGIRGIIVGDGMLKDEVLGYLKQSGMEGKIITPGLQTEVRPWYSAMDIFMMTSVFEGLPIAMLEAMSMECAIVTTDAGGIKEVIRSGRDGLMVGVDDWQKLEVLLNDLIEHPAKVRDFGRKARERVTDAFSIKGMVKATEKIYQNILQY